MIAFEAKNFFSSSGVQTSTTCVGKRNCRSSRPLGYPTRYKIELIFLVIIHANSYDCGRSRQTLGYVSFELIRVMTSTLTFQHILDVVYISLKKPSILLYSKHTKYFKKVKIFSTFEPSSRPISDFFTLFRKLFKVISWVKQSPKGHEKALEAFLNTCSCFMPQIHICWSSVY